MKRVLGLILALSSMGFVVSADAKTTNASNENSSTIAASSAPQWQRNRGYNRRYERRRTVTRSRYVRYGRRLYRETYLVTVWPNGRTDTRLISRQRVS